MAKEIIDYVVGDDDPTTGKKITYIAFQTEAFIITLDEEINLNWYAESDMKYAADFGEVVSQVNLTEASVDRIFSDKPNRIAYKKMLADVLARVMDECSSKTAMKILQEIKERVKKHSEEEVRMAYIKYAVVSVVVVGILVILTLIWRKELASLINQPDVFKIIVCTMLGGVGAFITTFARFNNYKGSVIAGLPIHRLDGFLRVFYGLIAGIVIALAIKGKVIAAFAMPDLEPWFLYFFAMMAGASEVIIPNLVKQAENRTEPTREENNAANNQAVNAGGSGLPSVKITSIHPKELPLNKETEVIVSGIGFDSCTLKLKIDTEEITDAEILANSIVFKCTVTAVKSVLFICDDKAVELTKYDLTAVDDTVSETAVPVTDITSGNLAVNAAGEITITGTGLDAITLIIKVNDAVLDNANILSRTADEIKFRYIAAAAGDIVVLVEDDKGSTPFTKTLPAG